MSKRNGLFDVCKGILIVIVVFHHIGYQAEIAGVNDIVRRQNLYLLPTYCSWFMPAFFLITGYCTNFTIPFSTFLAKNMKTLIWPAVTSFVIIGIYRAFFYYESFSLSDYFEPIIIWGLNWFLITLFFSKMLYYGMLNVIANVWNRLVFSFFLSFIAIYMNDINLFGINYLHHRHALYLTLFLCIGDVLKDLASLFPNCHSISKAFAIIFLPILLLSMKHVGVLPGIAGVWINFDYVQVPFHIFLALCGSCFLLYFSKILGKTKVFLYIGINSLVFYLFHVEILRFVETIVSKCIINPQTMIQVVAFDLFTLLLSLAFCSVIAYLFSLRSLRWIIKLP